MNRNIKADGEDRLIELKDLRNKMVDERRRNFYLHWSLCIVMYVITGVLCADLIARRPESKMSYLIILFPLLSSVYMTYQSIKYKQDSQVRISEVDEEINYVTQSSYS